MLILGLTGSIGMGKSWAAQAFRFLGVPVFDADEAVHGLTGKNGPVLGAIDAAFPGTVVNNRLDRRALAARVFGPGGETRALARLEAIIHPLVRLGERAFIDSCTRHRRRLVVLAVPLLFEAGDDAFCDFTVVVSAPAFLQKQRVLMRPGMTVERFEHIVSRQLADGEKRRRADFIIPTGLDRGFSLRAVRDVVTVMHFLGGGGHKAAISCGK